MWWRGSLCRRFELRSKLQLPGTISNLRRTTAVEAACVDEEAGAKRALLLPVGWRHSPMMEPAREELTSSCY
jgi:hypothetical protein